MRIATAITSLLLGLPLTLSGCHGHSGYDTLQACYDEHRGEEGLSVQESIVTCCLDHEVDGMTRSCRDTQPDCVTHVEAELDASATPSDIAAACTEYIDQKG